MSHSSFYLFKLDESKRHLTCSFIQMSKSSSQGIKPLCLQAISWPVSLVHFDEAIIMMILLMVVIMTKNNCGDFADYLTIPRVVPLDVQNVRLTFKRGRDHNFFLKCILIIKKLNVLCLSNFSSVL